MKDLKLIFWGIDTNDLFGGEHLSSYQLCEVGGRVVAEAGRTTLIHTDEISDLLPEFLEKNADGCYVSLEVDKRSSLTPDHIELLGDVVDTYNWEYSGAI